MASNFCDDPREGMVLVSGKHLQKLVLLGTFVSHLYENEIRKNDKSCEDDALKRAEIIARSLRETYTMFKDDDFPYLPDNFPYVSTNVEDVVKLLERPVDEMIYGKGDTHKDDE